MSHTFEATRRSIKMERIPGPDSEINSADEIEMLTKEPTHIAVAEREAAKHIQESLNDTLGLQGANQELTEKKLQILYDPSLPTVGIDAIHALAGAELLGMSSSRGFKKELNVIYLNMPTCGFTYTQHEDGLVEGRVRHAHMIDAQGNVLSGEVPDGLHVDAIESVDIELLSTLNSVGFLTLSQPDNLKKYSDKLSLEEAGRNAGVVVPSRLRLDTLTAGDDIVIKPSNASQGRGIYFGAQHDRTMEDWARYYAYLDKKGYAPVIEERVECWPLYDPITNERLDWNVRAITSHGELVDMYIRAGAEASAVNRSTGARLIAMDDLGSYLGVDAPASAQIIKKSLQAAAESVAESVDDFVTGIDLTINSHGEVVMFEVNAGHVGGLQTIAEVNDSTIHRRLEPARKIVNGIARRMPDVTKNIDGAEEKTLPLTLDMKIDFLREIDMIGLFANEIDESAHTEVEPFTRMRVLMARMHQARVSLSGEEVINQIAQEAMMSPFEIMHYIPYIPMLGLRALKASFDEFIDADPHSKEARILKIYSAEERSDLKTLFELASEEKDKSVLRHASRVLRRITEEATQGLLPDGDLKKEIDEVLQAHLSFMLIAGESERVADINDALIMVCKNVPEKYTHSLLSRAMFLVGRYDLVARHLDAVDLDDEDIIDYHINTLNMHQELMLQTDAGQDLVATYFMGLGGAEALVLHKEKHGNISENAERAVAQYNHFFESEQKVDPSTIPLAVLREALTPKLDS